MNTNYEASPMYDYETISYNIKLLRNWASSARKGEEGTARCVENYLYDIIDLDIYASKVAKTVLSTMSPDSDIIAKISYKQASVLVRAAIENGIPLIPF